MARGTSASPKSETELAGHRPAPVGGWLRMTCKTSGDPSWRDGGKLAGDDSGPMGATLEQPATASTAPAKASELTRADSERDERWKGMSLILSRPRWRAGMSAAR